MNALFPDVAASSDSRLAADPLQPWNALATAHAAAFTSVSGWLAAQPELFFHKVAVPSAAPPLAPSPPPSAPPPASPPPVSPAPAAPGAVPRTLSGTDADDRLHAGAGDERVDGGAGTDTLVYPGERAGHEVAPQAGGGWSVTDRAGDGGHDVLSNVERLRFDDADVLLQWQAAAPALRILYAVDGTAALHDAEAVGRAVAYAEAGMAPQAIAHALVGYAVAHGAPADALAQHLAQLAAADGATADTAAGAEALAVQAAGAHESVIAVELAGQAGYTLERLGWPV